MSWTVTGVVSLLLGVAVSWLTPHDELDSHWGCVTVAGCCCVVADSCASATSCSWSIGSDEMSKVVFRLGKIRDELFRPERFLKGSFQA